ncbi:hypothetical protein I4U23_013026 [Adineta vaga]|nr:hypothetical protein I4U23_013026 [Adineta vaga]
MCDQLTWNALETDSKVFLLTRYLQSEKFICSINDIDLDSDYKYMCQYVLDFCFANDICGKHGRCVNSLVGFKCSCYFWSDGLYCRNLSMKFIQLSIGLFIVLLLFILTFQSMQTYQQRCVNKFSKFFETLFKTQEATQGRQNPSDSYSNQISISPSERQERKISRLLFVFILMCIILICLHLIPIIHHVTSFPLYKTDQLTSDLLIQNIVEGIQKCTQKSIWNIDNHIFFLGSFILCFIFSFMIEVTMKNSSVCTSQPGDCLSPSEPFETENRYETAALYGIVMLEVLIALEHVFIDITELWNQGVLSLFLVRALIPLLYSIRYYSIFSSLQHRSTCVRFFAFLYIIGNIGYIVIRRSLCMDYLPLSKRFTLYNEALHRLKLGTLIILYGVLKNTPYFILLSYIGAELTVRFIYDSVYLTYKKRTKVTSVPSTPACVFTFESITGTSSIYFLIFCLEEIFNIDIDDWSFNYQILSSAILTFLVFTIQLFYGIVKYKEHTKQLKEKKYDEIPSKENFGKNAIASQSVGYLSSIFLNTVGGFFIWFHTILFIINICSFIGYYVYTLQFEYLHPLFSILSFILPLLVLYGLNRNIKQWLCTFASSKESEHADSNKSNDKIYAVLICFTFIFSCHIAIISSVVRLINGLLWNILLMPRIDCSYLGRTCEKFDSGFMAYASYLHVENAIREPIQSPLLPVQTNKESEEIKTVNLAVAPAQSTTRAEKDTYDTDSLAEEESDEADTYGSRKGTESKDQHDTQSVKSSNSIGEKIDDTLRKPFQSTTNKERRRPAESQRSVRKSSNINEATRRISLLRTKTQEQSLKIVERQLLISPTTQDKEHI